MTTQAPPSSPLSAAGVVADARVVLGDLDELVWAAKSPADLLAVNVELERLRSQVAAVQAQVAAEVEASEAHKVEGWASPGDYLTATAAGRRGHGQRLLRTARGLTGEREATWVALRRGDISPEQAQVIVAVVDLLPVDRELRARAERMLLEAAALLNASELRTAGEHLLEVLDPEGVAKREERALSKLERSAHLNRFLAIVDDGLGGVRVKGRGTVEDAAVIKAALAALAAPAARDLENTDPDCGDDGRDPRDHGARTWDALVETCQRALDTEVLPADHGAKPRVTVTLRLEDLQTGLGVATLDTGDRLSASAVRKLACHAEIIPIVLGTEGEVLDVGRAQRLVTPAIWKALVERDRRCRFPGCRRPPVACDAHHIVHWADGGGTALDNLVLLCRAHHTVIHTTAWQVRLNPHDHGPEFRPPPRRHRLTPELRERLDERDDWVRERRPRE